MSAWRRVRLFSMIWASSIESSDLYVRSLCLIASLNHMLVCKMSYMHMRSLKLLDPDTWCNPRCLPMHGRSTIFFWDQFLQNLCTCGNWVHPLAEHIWAIVKAHTLCCGCIIYVHHSTIFTSLQLSFSLCFEPSLSVRFEAFTEGLKCLSTLIHPSLQALPSPQKWWNW